MKTKIISFLTLLVILVNIMPIATVFASDTSFSLTITADKTKANAGDTITYTITTNATVGITVLDFYLDIPNGLTYVKGSGTVGTGVGNITEHGFTENDLGQLYTFAHYEPFSLSNVILGTFQCKVNDNASGNYQVGVKELEVSDEDFAEISSSNITKNYPTVEVELNATGVSLDKTSVSLNVKETTTLVATLTPEGTTDRVKEWSSSNTNVATVDNGKVTAIAEGTATITVKTTNDKTATCTITVTCAHNNKTEVAKKEATCTATGNNKYYNCNDCGKILKEDGVTKTTVEKETIDALGHDFSNKERDDKYHWKVCSRCGEISNKEEHSINDWQIDEESHWKECGCGIIIDKAEHTAGAIVKENVEEATCKEKGKHDEVVYCTECKEELSRTTVEDAKKTEHTPSEAVKEKEVAATCTKEGSYDEVIYCSVCKKELDRESKTTEKTAHTPAEAVKENEIASTIEKEGSYDEVIYCKDCKIELSRESKITPKFVYEVIEGKDGEHQDKTEGTLTFKLNGEISKFLGLKIDDIEVDKANYVVKSGSTIVTLGADYLNSLSIGTHKITFVYDDGEVTTNFKIAKETTSDTQTNTETSDDTTNTNPTTNTEGKTETTNSDSVNTGDNSNMLLWIVGLAVSGILFVIVLKCTEKTPKGKH